MLRAVETGVFSLIDATIAPAGPGESGDEEESDRRETAGISWQEHTYDSLMVGDVVSTDRAAL